MELKIKITPENKDKVFQLISELLESETEGIIDIGVLQPGEIKTTQPPQFLAQDYLKIPKEVSGLENGHITEDNEQARRVGTWGQFNSFFPVKAALRILANLMEERNVDSIKLDEFVGICIDLFRKKKLEAYRGFPSSNKDTAVGRFVWHFLTPAQEMGLIKVKESNLEYDWIPNSQNDWGEVSITLTRQGLEFAMLKNNLFDSPSPRQILTEEEKEWIVEFLKRIDDEGYKEYSLLKDVFEFLKQGHNGKDDLWNWFEKDQRFIDYVKSWSRKARLGREEDVQKQIRNLAMTFSASKVALLRELGVVNNRRNDYTIMGELE